MRECLRCSKQLTGKQKHYCCRHCRSSYRAAECKAERHRRGLRPSRPNQITDEKIAEVKAMYPSCARDWDVEMVDKAWDRLTFLLPRKVARMKERPSA